MFPVENISGPVAVHGEGPVWSSTWGGLRYVDLMSGDILTLRSGGVERRHVGSIAAFLRPRIGGGFVVALERGLALADTPDGELTYLGDLFTDPNLRFNDGGCSPAGTLYGGTLAYDHTPGAACLYRWAASPPASAQPDGPPPNGTPNPSGTPIADVLGPAHLPAATVAVPGVTISNGLAFSPDGRRCYYVDTPTGRIDVFDNVDDQLCNRRPFAQVEDAQAGHPDGICVDVEGGVWVAMYAGGAVRRYDSDGVLSAAIRMPVSRPTALTFGGANLKTLFITTSHVGLVDGEEPRAGSVYAAYPGVAGLPVLPFAG